MDTEEKKGPRPFTRVLSIAAIVIVAGAVIGAVVVVANNSGKIGKPEIPAGLPDPSIGDPDIVRFPKTMARRLIKLNKRYTRYRDQEGAQLTTEQDSLRAVSDSAFAHVRGQVAVFDTLSDRARRVQHAKDVTQMYKDLKRPVRAFARTFLEADSNVDPDSLDTVLQQLLSQ